MSQKSSIEYFSGSNLNKVEILDELFMKFTEEIDCHAKSKILDSLVQAYLIHFKHDLESNIKLIEFLECLSQVPQLCTKFLHISESVSFDGISNSSNLESKNKNLESASLCFDNLLVCLESFNLSNHRVFLIRISLNILSQGYSHCQESEMIYVDLLEQFADQLGLFFKKIEKLQTVVLQLLDEVDVKKGAEDEPNVKLVVQEMGNLCQIVFSLDADIAFELWAKYISIISHYEFLKQISNINSLSAFLAVKNIEVLQQIKFNLDKNLEEDQELSAKFFFYLDALASLINLAYDTVKENVLQFITFLLNLLDCLVLCHSSFTSYKTGLSIIKNSLVKNTFPLLSNLYKTEEFLNQVILTPSDKQFQISILLLKLCSVQFIDGASIQFKESLLKDIFSDLISDNAVNDLDILYSSVPRCSVTETKSEELITLYQLAYEQITKLLKLMPDSFIEEMESLVISYLMSSSDVVYLLISDVWIYRLRCTSVEFIKDRCYHVLQNLNENYTNNYKIENFLKRMLRFLPHSHKGMLLEAFGSLKVIQDDKCIQHRFGIPDHTTVDKDIRTDSVEQIEMMISKLHANPEKTADLVNTAVTCLELCALFVNVAESFEILQFLEFASEMMKTDIYEIQVAILTFIRSLSRKHIPENNQEFGKIVTLMAQLFSEAMHSKNFVVKYEARNIFGYFAKCTPHIKIVQETVKRDSTLKPIMKSYINAIPEGNFMSERDKAAYLSKQKLIPNDVKFQIPSNIIEYLRQIFSRFNFQNCI